MYVQKIVKNINPINITKIGVKIKIS